MGFFPEGPFRLFNMLMSMINLWEIIYNIYLTNKEASFAKTTCVSVYTSQRTARSTSFITLFYETEGQHWVRKAEGSRGLKTEVKQQQKWGAGKKSKILPSCDKNLSKHIKHQSTSL